jgi:uncharacterized OsmC-like protein
MTTAQTLNGVNVETLVATVGAVKNNPQLARFTFRAQTKWIEGGHSRTTIQGFHGVGAEDTSRSHPFVLEGDEPPVLLGTNKGPNAVEGVLASLASCLAVGFAYNAAAQGIRLDSLTFEVEGDLDLQGFLGLSDRVRPGYGGVRVAVRIKSNATPDQLKRLSEYVQQTSPVLDIIRNPVPVNVSIESR